MRKYISGGVTIVSRKIALYVIAIIAVLLYGTAGTYILGSQGNFSVHIGSFLEALYFTVVTISTVGYGDITPVTDAGRVFTITLIISGLSIFLSAVTVLSGDLLSSKIEELSTGINKSERRKLDNHIVLIGYDATNALVAQRLARQKRNFIVITGDKPTADALKAKGYSAFVADYTMRSDMEKFILHRASNILIDIRDSSKTVYVVLVVKKLAKNAKVSVFAPNSEAEAHLADLGIDTIINPVTIAADMMMDALDKGK
ncbi:MAG: NAD-binding protein [Candidatus Micrarchaeota archaeon]|nr:NAD-binding protein [Candidatus Micrarchaeota archaeon]MDE1859574.1 NAD-binding protein [Candidatus Micrarchaeota archaeon]